METAMLPTPPAHEIQRLTARVADAARMLNVTEGRVRQMNLGGLMPRPVVISKALTWGVEELRVWLRAGAPPRSEWERIRSAFMGGGPQTAMVSPVLENR